MSSDPKLNIAHVITRMIVGGAQENTLLTIRGHLEHGHLVTLVTGPTEGREGKLLDFSALPGLKICEIPELCRELAPLQDFRAYRKLKEFFQTGKFDVVHTHSSKAGILGRIAARRAKVPVVVHTIHGQAFTPYEKWYRNQLYIAAEKVAARYCDRIYAVAQAMVDQSVAAHIAPREKYQVVYSGMETDRFANAPREAGLRAALGIPEQARVVMTLARLFPLKGYEFVPKAFALAAQALPDLHLLIIGDGAWREKIAAELAALGVAEKAHFAGLVAPEEVPRYLACGDLLWHLSLREGLPRSAVQALCGGHPVIGYKLDGTPEVVIDDETGFCLAPGNVSGVAEKTVEIFSTPGKLQKLGEAGRKLVLERFRWPVMAETLEAEYHRLLASVGGK